MPFGLPAISFLGLRGVAAYAALGATAVGGYVAATRVVPALTGGGAGGGGGRGPASSSAAAPTAELLATLTRSVAESTGRAATAGLGPGASLGLGGINLAGQVTGALARFAEQSTRSLERTQTELMRANTQQVEGVLRLLQSGTRAAAPPPATGYTPAPASPTPAVSVTPTQPQPVTVTPVPGSRTAPRVVPIAHGEEPKHNIPIEATAVKVDGVPVSLATGVDPAAFARMLAS